MKERADKILVDRGLAESRQKAQALVMAGLVYSGDTKIEKPGQRIDRDEALHLKERLPYVSRGGLKLEGALEAFNIDVTGAVAADLGSSTGGFTDCLLQRGARKIYAVDVDTRQLDWNLSRDARVIPIKKNARFLEKRDFGDSLDIVTLDLSFISLLTVFPALMTFTGKGQVVSLIKPQFEVGRNQVGKKGIVKDPVLHQKVIERIIKEAADMGFRTRGVLRSPIRGQKGNREFFIHGERSKEQMDRASLESQIRKAVWNE